MGQTLMPEHMCAKRTDVQPSQALTESLLSLGRDNVRLAISLYKALKEEQTLHGGTYLQPERRDYQNIISESKRDSGAKATNHQDSLTSSN